jgi:hypothetical protein
MGFAGGAPGSGGFGRLPLACLGELAGLWPLWLPGAGAAASVGGKVGLNRREDGGSGWPVVRASVLLCSLRLGLSRWRLCAAWGCSAWWCRAGFGKGWWLASFGELGGGSWAAALGCSG